MKVQNYLSLAMVTAFMMSCNPKNTTAQTSDNPQQTDNSPVETDKPVTDYKPAFAGQTRAAGVHTTTPLQVDKLATDLKKPWAVIPFPDGRLLITEKGGNMHIYDANGKAVKKNRRISKSR